MTSPMQKVAYHVDQGAVTMYVVDANAAVQSHPDEWSFMPWSPEDTAAARSAREQRYKEEVEKAKAEGVPPPPPLPPVYEPTDRQKAELDADTKARAEAAAIVKKAQEDEEKRRLEDERVKAAKTLLASPPPVPDPNERRPFGRTGEMTPAERAAAEKRAAAKAKAEEELTTSTRR